MAGRDKTGRSLSVPARDALRDPLPMTQSMNHERGVFHQLLHPNEEQHRLLAVDDAVVVRQRDVHHRPDLDLAVDRDRAVLDLVQAEDADLRVVDDRRRDERAEHAAVGDRERAAGEVVHRQLAVARLLRDGDDVARRPRSCPCWSASLMFGTTRPASDATAMPMLT